MSDFTKEELNTIKYWCRLESSVFLNKIQSLIDNYCEHELTTGCGVCSGVLDIVCVKCDKKLYENK